MITTVPLALIVGFIAALQPTQAQTPNLVRLTVGRGTPPSGSPSRPGSIGGTWRLGKSNTTNKIDAAYRYGNKVVIFGWSGCCVGITTIIDAGSGLEQLEFLEYYPEITTKGVIVFEQFYPHFTDPAILSNCIRALDLNAQIPTNVPKQYQVPTADVGVVLYPQTTTPGQRHVIESNFLVDRSGEDVFIIDRVTPHQDFCFVRVSLSNLNNPAEQQHCISALDLTGHPAQDTAVSAFSENLAGDLTLSINVGLPTGRPDLQDFELDKQTLVPERIPAPGGAHALRVPWGFLRRTALSFTAPDLSSKQLYGHLQDKFKAFLVIDKSGAVRDVTITGLPDDVSRQIKPAILAWRFKPTVLNGVPTEVTTEFMAQIAQLTKLPE